MLPRYLEANQTTQHAADLVIAAKVVEIRAQNDIAPFALNPAPELRLKGVGFHPVVHSANIRH